MELQEVGRGGGGTNDEEIDIADDRRLIRNDSTDYGGDIRRFQSSSSSSSKFRQIMILLSGVTWLIITIMLIIVLSNHLHDNNNNNTTTTPAPTPAPPTPSQQEIADCVNMNRQRVNPHIKGKGGVPLSMNDASMVITNVSVYTGVENAPYLPNVNIVVRNGIINEISSSANDPSITRRIDGMGLIVTPGLVDMHSHAGVYAWPEIWATSDGNEMTNPITSQVRAIDAFDPEDLAIPRILSGGVTTSQVLPGSGNIMGGEGAIFKLRGKKIADMFVENSPRILKMACGENPKRVYGHRGQMPMSRMGSAWLMRQRLDNARRMMEQQNSYCSSSSSSSSFPYDLELESLVSLLRDDAVLNVHCYQVQDLEMMMRLSDEFNFNVSAFHHALEAYKLPEELLERDITVATFSDLWGYKYEAYDASVHGPSILRQHNVAVAFKSDHPVLDASTLMYEAAKGHYYGLSAYDAIHAVTSVPAKAIKMIHKVGTLEVGKDADIVIWKKHPLKLGSKPLQVYINGEITSVNDDLVADPSVNESYEYEPSSISPDTPFECNSENTNVVSLDAYAFDNVNIYVTPTQLLTNQMIVVINGTISCISSSCDLTGVPFISYGSNNVYCVQRFVDAGSGVGMLEIDAEGSAQDGFIGGSGSNGKSAAVHAYDGVRIVSRHVRAAWSSGIGVSIAHPQGSQLVGGLSTAFHTCYGNGCPESIDNLFVQETVALHVSVGNQAKDSGIAASISGELEALRLIFDKALTHVNDSLSDLNRIDRYLVMALRHDIPVVAEVYQADTIAAVIRLRNEFNFRLTLLGAAEAGVVKELIANTSHIEGVLMQASVPPSTFDTLRYERTHLIELHQLGVKVGLYVADPDNGRNLRFEAGLTLEDGFTTSEALETITTNVNDMFGIANTPITVNEKADFVIFDGKPLSLQSRVQTVVHGTNVHCNPRQF